MSKKYKGKRCAYCATPNSSEDGDHVVCRQFFLPEKRADLPIVPACKACNNAKSKLEHYLTAVMPFGGRHAGSSRNLAEMVPPRLEKNAKLFRSLKEGARHALEPGDGGQQAKGSVPLDGAQLIQLFKFIGRGLANWHWEIYLEAETCVVIAAFIHSAGREIFERLLAMDAKNRVRVSLGGGVFVYEGAQSTECPELTMWRMSLYGAEVGGDPKAPKEGVSEAYVITAPRRMPVASKLVQLLGDAAKA